MTVQQLIRALEDYDPNVEVHIAFQPNHPLKAAIDNVVALRECPKSERDGDGGDDDDDDEENPNDVWLVAGKADGYVTKRLWER